MGDPLTGRGRMDDAGREACERYVTDLFASEDEVLVELRRAMDRADLPQIYISAEEGKLLQVLLRAVGRGITSAAPG